MINGKGACRSEIIVLLRLQVLRDSFVAQLQWIKRSPIFGFSTLIANKNSLFIWFYFLSLRILQHSSLTVTVAIEKCFPIYMTALRLIVSSHSNMSSNLQTIPNDDVRSPLWFCVRFGFVKEKRQFSFRVALSVSSIVFFWIIRCIVLPC